MTDVSLRQGKSSSAHTVQIGPVTLVFSYSTCVAFADGRGWVVCENIWSTTTGKHIAQETPSGVERTPFMEFELKLKAVTDRIRVQT